MKLTAAAFMIFLSATATAQTDVDKMIQKSKQFYQRLETGVFTVATLKSDPVWGDTIKYAQTFKFDRGAEWVQASYTEDAFYIYSRDSGFTINSKQKTISSSASGYADNIFDQPFPDISEYFNNLAFDVKFGFKEFRQISPGISELHTKTRISERWVHFENETGMILRTARKVPMLGLDDAYEQKSYQLNNIKPGSPAITASLRKYQSDYTTPLQEPGFSEEEFKKTAEASETFLNSLKGKKIDRVALVKQISAVNKIVVGENDYIILDFFYQACKPCAEAMTYLKKASATSSQLKIFGLDQKEMERARMPEYIKRRGINYPILIGKDATNAMRIVIPEPFFVTSYPTLIVIAPDGTVRLVELGLEDNLDQRLLALVNAK